MSELLKKERENGGTLDVDRNGFDYYFPQSGYINKDYEKIVGLQTDAPLKRAIMPNGGIRMVKQACEAYGYKLIPTLNRYTLCIKSHNQGVFDAYAPDIRRSAQSRHHYRSARRIW